MDFEAGEQVDGEAAGARDDGCGSVCRPEVLNASVCNKYAKEVSKTLMNRSLQRVICVPNSRQINFGKR
jgi:hypothetical protein